jgi:uncharacterized membrane protein YfcA
MNPVGEAGFLVAAGTLAGTATSAGAIASLISYPALLLVGIGPVAANVTNSIAVVGTGIASTLASGSELQGTGRKVLWWSLYVVVGAVAGAVLLLTTPDGLFTWVVPFLVAAASVLLLLQPRISALSANSRVSGEAALPIGLFAVGVYNGYFGAASGIMTLALLMITAEARLVHANALKNVVLGASDVVVAGIFIAFAPIDWPSAVALGGGFLVGGSLGPALARRTPVAVLRLAIAGTGFVLAAGLLVAAGRQSNGL